MPPSDPTYPQYLATCPQPLAANDYVLTDLALWQLDRPVTEVAPIRIATRTPGGSNVLNDLNGWPAIFVGLGSSDACAPITQFKIVGIATQGCNYSFGSTLYPQVAAGLRQLLGAANVD